MSETTFEPKDKIKLLSSPRSRHAETNLRLDTIYTVLECGKETSKLPGHRYDKDIVLLEEHDCIFYASEFELVSSYKLVGDKDNEFKEVMRSNKRMLEI